MKTLERLFVGSLAAAALLSLLGCAFAGYWQAGIFPVVLSGGWWWQRRQGMGWQTAVFLIYVGGLALVATINVGGIWLLPAALAALVAWDLDLFLQQPGTGNLVNEPLLVQAHLRALGQVAAAALLLGGAVLLIQIELNFWTAFTLAVVAVVVLGRMMGQFLDN